MKFALIKNGTVKNTIESTQSFIDQHFVELECDQALDVTGMYVGPGFSYSNGVFTAPPDPTSSDD